MKIEAKEKEKATLNASDMGYVDVVSTCLKRAKNAKILEVEVDKLRDVDRQIDRKVERIRLHFEELRNKLKSSG